MMSLCVAALLLGASCVPAEKQENLGKRWDETTVMGLLQREGVLRVAVSPNSPTAVDGAPGAYDSFAGDFGDFLGEVLGVEVQTVEVPAGQLHTGIETEDIDIAFPVEPITEQAVRTQAFSDPILVSHQRLLVPDGSAVTSIEDLEGERVCQVDFAEGYDLSATTAVDVITEKDPAFCADRLAQGDVAAVTAPDVVLLAVAERAERVCSTSFAAAMCEASNFNIVGDELTTQGYGVLMKLGASAWTDYVNLVLDKWIEEGGWADSYERNFGTAFTDEIAPPDLTVEEAAALYPSG